MPARFAQSSIGDYFLYFLAIVAAALFFAYQGGAFNSWVDQGKQVVNNQNPLNKTS